MSLLDFGIGAKLASSNEFECVPSSAFSKSVQRAPCVFQFNLHELCTLVHILLDESEKGRINTGI